MLTHPSVVVENEMKPRLQHHLKRTTHQKFKAIVLKNRIKLLFENSTLTDRNFEMLLTRIFKLYFAEKALITTFKNSWKIHSSFVSFKISLFFATFCQILTEFVEIRFHYFCTVLYAVACQYLYCLCFEA